LLKGIFISKIHKDGAAEKAGFLVGDKVLKVSFVILFYLNLLIVFQFVLICFQFGSKNLG